MAEPADDKDNARKLAPVGAIFVGMVAARNLARRGDDRPLKALEHAERLRKSGAGESQIYTETNKMFEGSPYAGVSYGADRKPRFEISDHSSELRTAALDPKGKGLQGNFLRHPDYYAAHPEAAHLDVFKHGTSGGGYGGGAVFVGDSHFAKTKLLGRPVANPTARGVNLHELQHHAQEAEGFAPGGSPKDFENRLPGERNAQMRRALYDRLAGEVEAENTRKRANMTPIERRAIHPTRTASIPRSEQVVTDQHGTVQEIFDPKSIKVTKLATGAAIKFDYDRETVADFKKSFPKAKWSQDTKTWHVPGKLAGNRADRWLAAQQDTAGKLAKADAIARDAVAFDGAPKSKYVQSLPVGYSVRTGYDPNIVKALKAIPGSSWDARHKIWMVPHRSANELKAALPTIEPLADKIAAAEKAQQDKLAAEKESQRKQWAAERAASTAARDTEMAKVRASRIAVHRSDNVKVGDAVMLMGKVAVVESFGREFRADDSFPSVHGSRWLGHEGERARYAYTREATPAETAAFNAKEAAAKAAQERITQLASSVRAARAQVDGKFNNAATPKKLAQLPAGETLAHFGKQNAAYGGGTEFRLSVDGKTIWRIQGNGADGDNWSANNAPGSIASKVRATKELVSKLRALGEVEGSGLRGTQNPENLKSILDGRKNKASANPAAPVAPVRIQEMAEDIKDFGEKIGGSRKDRAVKTAAKLEAVAKRVTIDGKPPGWSDAARAKSAEVRAADAKPEAVAAPAREVRQEGKRFTVHEGGKPIKDSKGADKWFGSKEKADAFLAKRGPVPAVTPKSAASTTSEWLADRDRRIKASKESGAKHLDVLPRAVEGMRGVEFRNVHDPKERGVVRTVANTGEVVVDWADKYSADKNLAETTKEGKKAVRRSWLAPTDLKDYVVEPKAATTGESSTPKRDVRAKVEAKPRAAVAGDNGGPSDKAIKTAAKLEAVAKRTIAEAQAVHDQPRQMNTARRARMGSGVMEEQQRKIANAKTALKIAEALRNGEAGALVKVESLADVERLSSAHRSAMYANKAKREEHRGSMTGVEPDRADIAHAKPAEMVRANISPSDIPRMKKALAGKGVARDLARLEKIASEKDGWRLTDPRDIESLGKVAKAIKTLDPKDTSWTEHKWQARSLQSDANRWMGEVREFQAKQRLGLTDAGELRATLEAFADARVNRKAADPVAIAERDLIGRKLPGFFPTPQTLAERMAQMAEIKPGMQVLEPSAGTGRLADAAKKLGAQVDAVEMQSSLRDILLKKGHNVVEHDFTSMKAEPKYDRIVMNPPFEKGQDIAHVRQAYDMLKPGGKMVAVMGEGAFFRGDTKASEFRNWLETVGTSEKLPEGTFKESNTGVNTRLVTITKPAEASSAVKNENRGWSDAARAASADARGVAKPGEAKPKPSPTVQSAVERAMAMQEAKAKASAPSTLVKPSTPTSQQLPDKPTTPAGMSGSGSKRYVTLGNGQKVGLGQYTNAWRQAKAMNPETGVRGTPSDPNGGGTAGDLVREMRAGMVDRINQKDPNYGKGRKWDATWQSDARRLADTMARKSEVPAGEAHPVDLRNKVADRLAPGTKLPPKGGTGIKGKVMGLMAPVAIGSAALIAMNESAKAGETTGQQVKAGSIEAVKGGAVMGGFVAGTIAITKGLTKAGLTAAKAVPATQAILMAGGAIHGAVTAKPGERMKGAAKGAWDMSVPGMVVNTYEAGKAAYHSTADRLSSPSRMTTEQAQHFNQANAAYKADHQSGPITVEQFERTRRLPSGAVVTETVSTHTRARRD